MYSAIQTLSGGEVWHSLSVGGGRTLLVLGGESEVQLLAWRGVYTPVQVGGAWRGVVYTPVQVGGAWRGVVYTPVQVGGDRNSITHTLVDNVTIIIMFTDCMSC